MATRSVYEVDDVVATLLYALQTKNHVLAVQAARELRVSEETDLLVNVLTFAQLLCDPRELPMITPPTHETMYDVLCLLMTHFPSQLPTHKPQIPIAPPSPLQTDQQYTFDWRIPSSFTPHQAHILESTVRTCILKKYWKQCIRILTPLLHKHICALSSLLQMLGISKKLTDILETIVYVPLSERLLFHAVIQLIFPQPPTKNTQYMTKYESHWNSTAVGRNARTFQVPRCALQQWNLQPKSAKRIQESLIPEAVADTQSTLYWQHAGLPSDANMEEWFRTHFPDDIPDEWLRDEILKSHVYEQSPIERQQHDWQPAFLLCWA